jgi:hypothetical protein
VKFVAVHDAEGNIVQLVGEPDDGPRLVPVAEVGMQMREVVLPEDFAADYRRAVDDGADASSVNELLGGFQVEIDRDPAHVRRRDPRQ